MAEFTIDIPDIGPVRVSGDFATESAINNLANAIRNSSSRYNNDLDDFNNNLNEAENNLEDFADASESSAKKLKTFNISITNGLNKISSAFGNFGNESLNLSSMLQNTGSSLGNAIGKIPIFGGLLESAILLFTGATAGFAGFAEGLTDINKNMFDSGLAFGKGLDEFANSAFAAKLPIRAFSEAILANSDQLRLLAGGAPGGIRRVSQAFGMFDKETRQQLFQMGYTTEEIVGAMIDYSEDASRLGKALSIQELSQGSLGYLKNLKELSRITGLSVKEQSQIIREQQANYDIQSSLAGIQNKEVQEATAQTIANLQGMGFSAETISMLMKGIVPNTEDYIAAQLAGLGPTVDGLGKLLQNSANNAIPSKEVLNNELTNIFGSLSKEQLARAQQMFKQVPGLEFGTTLQQLIISLTKAKEATDAGRDPLNQLAIENDGLTATIGNLQTTMLNLSSSIQSFLLPFISSAGGPLKFILDEANAASEGLRKLGKDIAIVFDPNETEKEKKSAINRMLEVGSNLLSRLKEYIVESLKFLLNEVGPTIADIISDGIYYGFKKLIDSVSWSDIFYNAIKSSVPGMGATMEGFEQLKGAWNWLTGKNPLEGMSKEELLEKRQQYSESAERDTNERTKAFKLREIEKINEALNALENRSGAIDLNRNVVSPASARQTSLSGITNNLPNLNTANVGEIQQESIQRSAFDSSEVSTNIDEIRKQNLLMNENISSLNRQAIALVEELGKINQTMKDNAMANAG